MLTYRHKFYQIGNLEMNSDYSTLWRIQLMIYWGTKIAQLNQVHE